MSTTNDAARPITDPIAAFETPRLSEANERFKFVSRVVGFTRQDIAIIHLHADRLRPWLDDIVDASYARMFEFDEMKKHFVPRQTGYQGVVPASLDQLKLDDDQVVYRKQKLVEYFAKLGTADYDETFATLVDLVGNMHTREMGNVALNVPPELFTAMLGFMADQYSAAIAKLRLNRKNERHLQRAYAKLFWIQNNMFIHHYTK